MNILLNSRNHLFELARMGVRLPHIVLAIVMCFAFVLTAQFTGGTLAIIINLLLSGALTNPPFNDPAALLEMLLPNTALEQTIFLILAFGPIFLILWGWLAVYEKRPFWTIGLERTGALFKYLRGLGVGLAMFVASIGISAALGYISFEDGDPQQQGLAALGGVLLVFVGWMVQGAAEETVTRGWLLPVIGARYRPLLGVVVSSVIFAVFHLFNPNLGPIAVINLALFGVFTAFYALYEGGVWGVFSIHAVWNWAQGNFFGFEVSGGLAAGGTVINLMEVGPDIITGGAFGPEGGLAVTVVLVVSSLIVWFLAERRKSPEIDNPQLL
jgi:membrane protease YdiL (CAAX protease family)